VKDLKIEVDGRVVFDGEVAEVQWQENDEQVSVTGRFKRSPSLQEMMARAAAERQLMQDASVPPGAVPNKSDNVLRLPERDDDE
jgi:hypothetical protein